MKKFSSTTRVNSRQISRNKRLRTVAIVAFVILILLFLVPRVMSYTASLVLAPVVAIEHWIYHSQDTIPAYFRDRSILLEERRDLERQLAEQVGSNNAINQLVIENESLRDLLSNSTSTRIGAAVIGRPTELPYDTILIDKGSADGIVERAPVFTGRDQVIGVVGEVYQRSAVVVLASTPDIETTVYIYGPNIYTTAVGVGGGLVRVHVPQGIELEEGNLVVMPSFDAGIYGEIVSIESVPTGPEQYGFVSIESPLSGLRFVSVGDTTLPELSFEDARAIVERERNNLLVVPVPEGVLVDTVGTTTATTTEETTNI